MQVIHSHSTQRELRNTLKTYSFHSDKLAFKGDILCLVIDKEIFAFKIVHKCAAVTFMGFHYSVLPTFNTNFRI